MMKGLRVKTPFALWLRLAALLGVVVAATSTRSSGLDALDACTQAAPRSLLHDERERLCRFASEIGTNPSTCAATVLRATNAFPAASTKHERADMVLELCSRASGAGPAVCWLTFPNQVRQQRELVPTLLSVCHNAPDATAAECFLHWRKFAASSPRASVQATTAGVAKLCNEFRGDLRALSSCVLQAPQSLASELRFRLCRHVSSANKIQAVIACAKELVSVHGVSGEMVSRVCASAEMDMRPQECVIASVRQLRWMDERSKVHLCEHSSSAEPVKCAMDLRQVTRTLTAAASSGGDQRVRELPVDVAQLCRQTRNASLTVSCATKINARVFTLPQLVRLCSSDSSHQQDNANELVHASRCVEDTKRLLGFIAFSNIGNDTAVLIFQLCEGATSTAPTDCMRSLQYNQELSTAQRVRLCSRAQSSSAQDCYSKLRHLIHMKKITVDGALALCAQVRTAAPALCVTELASIASTLFIELHAVALCAEATSSAPVVCYRRAPSSFSDHAKVVLCRLADSDAPASCARVSTTRVPNVMQKADLCHRAASTSPAVCAMAAPFGMDPTLIVALCRSANSDQPAKCARGISTSSQITWETITELCAQAVSTTPANCLAQRIRQHRGVVTHALVHECRSAVPMPASLEIVQVSYGCHQLVPKCRISIQLRVHDQFGAEMPSWTGGYLHLSAVPTDDTTLESASSSTTMMDRVVHGPTHAPITNGSALFADFYFAEAGTFIVAFGSSSPSARFPLAEKVARIRIQYDLQEKRRSTRCRALFTRLECGVDAERQHATSPNDAATDVFHFLELPSRFYFDALGCEDLWAEHSGGLRLLGTTSSSRLIFVIHRAAYRFLTDTSVPSPAMSAWACLELEEGASRAQIRRAYHRKALEWHPDKWASVDVRSLQSRATQVYARVTRAYTELMDSSSQRV